ncbi:MAG: hypothetical protein GDA52_11475 [Rhodobacteraceae bacterium]|nr:hypothetical protein [Paracoccaceae bacterium]
MSDSDSFFNDISEEVRRDRLFTLLRRWGWVGVLAILALVGGTAYIELRRSQAAASAEAFGDALLAAFGQETPAERLAALAAIPADTPEAGIILAFLQAGEEALDIGPGGTARAPGAAARLRALAGRADLPVRYRDLARLQAHLLDPAVPDEALQMLDELARPGAPYRALAMEQQAYVHLSVGETEAAITLLRRVQEEPQVPPGLHQRALQLIVALEAGVTLTENSPPE